MVTIQQNAGLQIVMRLTAQHSVPGLLQARSIFWNVFIVCMLKIVCGGKVRKSAGSSRSTERIRQIPYHRDYHE